MRLEKTGGKIRLKGEERPLRVVGQLGDCMNLEEGKLIAHSPTGPGIVAFFLMSGHQVRAV